VRTDELMQERIARNDARFRAANEEIEKAAQRYEVDGVPIPFLCECADISCRKVIRMSLDSYEEVRSDGRAFLSAPGHEDGAADLTEVVAERDGYTIVRKIDHAGEVAERLDPRKEEGPSPAQEEGS
jgi:hypothetical protein